MEKDELIKYIKEPEKLQFRSLYELMDIRDKYPYFQAIYPLILKLLKTNRRFQYQIFLGKTAVQLTGREILFEFINIDKNAYQKVAHQVQKDMQDELSVDLTADSMQLSDDESKDLKQPEKLYDSSPSNYNDYSTQKKGFNDWLKATRKKKIKRDEDDKSAEKPEKNLDVYNTSKTSHLVDQFIQKSPSITSPKKFESKKSELSVRDTPSSQLMTETLAEILVEQKKYKKAIQAYKILILNNPEKNGFFASQIEKIKELQEKHSS